MEELQKIVNTFQQTQVQPNVSLEPQLCSLISLAVLTTLGNSCSLKQHVEEALERGVTAEQMVEAVMQTTPYVGYPRVMDALQLVEEVLRQKGIELPQSQSTVQPDTRLQKGLEAQYAIFGRQTIDHNRSTAPEELKHIQDALSAYCFGDFYTRDTLELSTRELLTFCTLCALGGCESQLKAHIAGNLQVGNRRPVLIDAVTWCMPMIGFPRTLNAIVAINGIAKE